MNDKAFNYSVCNMSEIIKLVCTSNMHELNIPMYDDVIDKNVYYEVGSFCLIGFTEHEHIELCKEINKALKPIKQKYMEKCQNNINRSMKEFFDE